jgi:hypothetical protein
MSLVSVGVVLASLGGMCFNTFPWMQVREFACISPGSFLKELLKETL